MRQFIVMFSLLLLALPLTASEYQRITGADSLWDAFGKSSCTTCNGGGYDSYPKIALNLSGSDSRYWCGPLDLSFISSGSAIDSAFWHMRDENSSYPAEDSILIVCAPLLEDIVEGNGNGYSAINGTSAWGRRGGYDSVGVGGTVFSGDSNRVWSVAGGTFGTPTDTVDLISEGSYGTAYFYRWDVTSTIQSMIDYPDSVFGIGFYAIDNVGGDGITVMAVIEMETPVPSVLSYLDVYWTSCFEMSESPVITSLRHTDLAVVTLGLRADANADTLWLYRDAVLIDSIAAGISSYTDTLQTEGTYCYALIATNACDTLESLCRDITVGRLLSLRARLPWGRGAWGR